MDKDSKGSMGYEGWMIREYQRAQVEYSSSRSSSFLGQVKKTHKISLSIQNACAFSFLLVKVVNSG